MDNLPTRMWKGLTYKDGQFSKTALWLSLGVSIGIFLWLTQSLFAGLIIHGHTIPEFSIMNASGILTLLIGLYLGNHKIKGTVTKDSVSFEQNKE